MEEIAKKMYGRYSLVKRAKKKMNSWDLNFEEIERGVVKVVPRKPTPLFSPAVEKEKNYVHAMNVPAPRPPLAKKGGDVGKKFGLGRKVVDPTKQVEVPETSSSSISAKAYSPHPPQSSPVRKRKNNIHKSALHVFCVHFRPMLVDRRTGHQRRHKHQKMV